MGKRNLITLLSITFTVTLLFLILQKNPSDPIQRILITQNDLSSYCSDINTTDYFGANYFNAINNITYAYSNFTIGTLNNLTDNKGAELFTKLLIDIMKKNDINTSSQEYVKNRLTPYIIFILFAGLSFIGLFFYCTSCCCPCRCCKKTDEGNCCRFFSIAIAFLFSVGAGLVSILGLAFSKGFLNSVSALNCAILTFYFDITAGQNTTSSPRWIGVDGIYSTLQNMKTKLSAISSQVDGTFSGDSFLDTDPPKYQQTLDSLYSNYNSKTLPNPNPANTAQSKPTVVPYYIKNYGTSTTPNTALYLIAQEYDITINASKNIVRQIKTFSSAIKQNIGDITNQLDTISTQVNSLNQTIQDFSSQVINNLVNAQTQMRKSGMTVFYIFFSFILGLNVFNLLGILLFGCCKVGFFKWFSHLSWFLNAIFMIVTFILGSAYCIFSVFGEDSSKSFLYLFSDTSLSKGDLFADQANSKIISICINQDGDLANKYFNLSSTGVDNVAKLYNASLALNQIKNNISQYNNSIAISTLKKNYQNNSNDIRTVPFPDSDTTSQVSAVFEAWYGWSDSNKNKQMASCSSPAMDLFYQTQDNCPSGYTLTSNQNPKANLGSKSCLIIKSWDQTSVNTRYSSYNCAGNSDFSNPGSANYQYWQKFSNFIDQNTILLNSIISDHDQKLASQFSDTITKVVGLISKVQNLVNPLVDLLQSLVGQNSFYNMINSNIINVFGGNFSDSCRILGILILLISFLNAFSVFFTIFMINFTIDPPSTPSDVPVQNIELGNKNDQPAQHQI